MLKNVIFVVCDGLGDRPVAKLGGKTPLEAALTPNLDALAREGECGIMHTLGRGVVPGSDAAHLGLFGYDPLQFYSGRGPIEAAGVGLKLQDGDVAFRGNFGTVSEDLQIVDRRAGRIRDVTEFVEAINGMEFDGVQVIVRAGTAHRAIVLLRGEDLSSDVTDMDPHVADAKVAMAQAKSASAGATRTAAVLNKFVIAAAEKLRGNPTNKKRIADGLLPADFLLLRGGGRYSTVPPFSRRWGFSAACVAGGGLYKGIGAFLGMEVIPVAGATALPDTDVGAKLLVAIDALKKHDFVFVHIKAADSLGEDGNAQGKCEFIERMDPAFSLLRELGQETLIVVTADHSTPCELSAHSADGVPLLMRGMGVRTDKVIEFGERACVAGGIGFIIGADLMPHIKNLFGRLHLYGA